MSLASYFQTASAAGNRTGGLARFTDIALVAGIVAIIALMIVPLPTWAIDVLVAVNIAGGVLLLLLAIYVANPLEFSVFPSVLLISTLFRLALSIATTRMILLHGEAGHIIQTFGHMVAGGNLVVGLVVFLIITVVQFIVIAKGSERVAEVAARFSLDAMPGKQMSIDSDLRSGLIDKDEARRRRRVLENESKLNGSLDGAMMFVKGDAICGIVIILINLLGGLAIGVLQLDMTNYGAGRTFAMRLMTDNSNPTLQNFVTRLFDTYLAPLGLSRGTDTCGYACSDHASWTSAGYPAAMMAEPTFFTRLHTTTDTLAYMGDSAAVSVKQPHFRGAPVMPAVHGAPAGATESGLGVMPARQPRDPARRSRRGSVSAAAPTCAPSAAPAWRSPGFRPAGR